MPRIDDPGPASRLEPYPQPAAADFSSPILKIGMAAIPVLGGPAAELFAAITGPLLGKRRDEWCETVRTLVNDLSTKPKISQLNR